MTNHPGSFNNQVGEDLYLNPWWGLDTIHSWSFKASLREAFGEPDLWFNGCFHELLWGPREVPKAYRPQFHVNLSGPQGRIYRSFWLPWRASHLVNTTPYAANVQDDVCNVSETPAINRYAEMLPRIIDAYSAGYYNTVMTLLRNCNPAITDDVPRTIDLTEQMRDVFENGPHWTIAPREFGIDFNEERRRLQEEQTLPDEEQLRMAQTFVNDLRRRRDEEGFRRQVLFPTPTQRPTVDQVESLLSQGIGNIQAVSVIEYP